MFLPAPRSTTAEHPAHQHKPFEAKTFFRIADRTVVLRALCLTALSIAIGMSLCKILLPLIPTAYQSAILTAHLPGDSLSPLAWLRLCGARLPILLLIALAGLTRFSGGLTTTVLLWRGLSDGMALGLLISLTRGLVSVDALSISPLPLLLCFLGWMLTDALLRSGLAVCAKRLAGEPLLNRLATPQNLSNEDKEHLRYRLWQYLFCVLVAVCLSAVLTGLYIALLVVLG